MDNLNENFPFYRKIEYDTTCRLFIYLPCIYGGVVIAIHVGSKSMQCGYNSYVITNINTQGA